MLTKMRNIFDRHARFHLRTDFKRFSFRRAGLGVAQLFVGLIISLIFFGNVAHAGPFGSKTITLFGSYGYEKKYDIYPGLTDSANYFGGFINVNELFEGQVLITTGSNDSKNHYSANFHHAFFKTLQPFVNLGLGYMASGGTHLNFDVGLQLAIERIRLRVFYKSQNKMWGETKFGDAAMMFAAGLTL